MSNHTLQALFRLLTLAAEGGLIGITPQPSGRFLVEVVDGDQIGTACLTVHEIDLSTATEPPKAPQPGTDTDAQWLTDHGFPPYYNRAWLLRQLHRFGGDPDRLAADTEYAPDSIREMIAHFGIEGYLNELIWMEWSSGRFAMQKDLAAHLGVSKGTVSKAVGQGLDAQSLARIEALLDEGADAPAIIQDLRQRGDRRNDDKLRHLIRRARTRRSS